jgi:hypothetical protein
MTLSVFISLFLCFRDTMLVVGTVLLTLKNWALRSDRPFTAGHVEDELSIVISTKWLIWNLL